MAESPVYVVFEQSDGQLDFEQLDPWMYASGSTPEDMAREFMLDFMGPDMAGEGAITGLKIISRETYEALTQANARGALADVATSLKEIKGQTVTLG